MARHICPRLERLLDDRGPRVLQILVDGIAAGRSGQAIADEIGVSRERVRQWKAAWMRSQTSWTVDPAVAEALEAFDGRRRPAHDAGGRDG